MKTLLASLLTLLLLGCVTPAYVADPSDGHPDPTTTAARFGSVRLTADGPRPAIVHLDGDEGGVAFVNDTAREVYSIRFVGPVRPDTDSVYTRDFTSDDRATYTERPLRPGDVASVYLDGPGTYAFEVVQPGRDVHRGELRLVVDR